MLRPTAVLVALLASAGPSVADPGPDLGGRWSGYWVSDKNGHHGPLRATFRQVSADRYRVTFTGRFWKVVPFVYSVNLTATGGTGDVVTLSGSTPVGPVVGAFRYEAVATRCEFEARFTSRNDWGRFVLSRR
jgi:hypothetical protein